MKLLLKPVFTAFFLITLCSAQSTKLPLHLLNHPPGFKIELYATGLEYARSMTVSPNGTVFVGTRKGDVVYAIRDTDNDGVADEYHTVIEKLWAPNGVVYYDGALYVAEINRILRFDDLENRLDNPPTPVVIRDDFPKETWHGWKYIDIGPDGKLYIAVGMPCNVCERSDERFGTIMRMNLDGSNLEVYAKGIRNSVGFDWHPLTKDLWFTDNGRDNLGDDLPPDELNRVTQKGDNFGFPYCHAGYIADSTFGKKRACNEFTPPAQKLGPHVAALGVKFYDGEMFPAEYRNQIFIAEHGSWNRSSKIGYRVSLVKLEGSDVVSYETFIDGWLQPDDNVWGRPVDIELLPDGSMLISDDALGSIYRVRYEK